MQWRYLAAVPVARHDLIAMRGHCVSCRVPSGTAAKYPHFIIRSNVTRPTARESAYLRNFLRRDSCIFILLLYWFRLTSSSHDLKQHVLCYYYILWDITTSDTEVMYRQLCQYNVELMSSHKMTKTHVHAV